MRVLWVAVVMVLTGCSADEMGAGLYGSAKNWCRSTPQSCSVHDDAR